MANKNLQEKELDKKLNKILRTTRTGRMQDILGKVNHIYSNEKVGYDYEETCITLDRYVITVRAEIKKLLSE